MSSKDTKDVKSTMTPNNLRLLKRYVRDMDIYIAVLLEISKRVEDVDVKDVTLKINEVQNGLVKIIKKNTPIEKKD